QLLAHAQANIKLGNDKEFLMKVIEQNVPFIGYPRSLNAVTIVNKADEAVNGKD
ncbi:MAG: carboxymuconolactone decarboxylase, partial [Lactobacillus amylovorus]